LFCDKHILILLVIHLSNSIVVRLAQYKDNKGVSAREAIDSANSRKLTLLPNTNKASPYQSFEARLLLTDVWTLEQSAYPSWSGTFFAHGKPNKKLPKTLEYVDHETGERWILDVPSAAQGTKNTILAINHGFTSDGSPIIKLQRDSRNIVVEIADPKRIAIVENFPVQNGWHAPDPDFGIPVGPNATGNPQARHLWRDESEKIGLLARQVEMNLVDIRNFTITYFWPSLKFGALALESGPADGSMHPKLAKLIEQSSAIIRKSKKDITPEEDQLVMELARTDTPSFNRVMRELESEVEALLRKPAGSLSAAETQFLSRFKDTYPKKHSKLLERLNLN
jgi:hypothetical protein